MRAAAWPLALPLLLAAVAGCLSSDPGPVDAARDPGGDPAKLPATMEFTGCRQVGINFFADPAEVRPLLPPGFEPRGPGGLAELLAYHPTCQATLDGTPIGEVDELWIFAIIDPPTTGSDRGASAAYYHLGIFTSSPETAEAYRAWGISRVHVEAAST
ncbi:MAG: hypothetical protein R3185_08535, partial [Candidatus Thermoplasmatota archaeon]|nr:hypothetical protein [Candidatus Thermoplasmatota archaeon]